MTGWDQLVATAMLGTRRKVVDLAALPEAVRVLTTASDPARELLHAAALMAGYRRAGLAPVTEHRVISPAPVDGRAILPFAARHRLGRMLLGDHTGLLGEWLRAVERTEYRLPAEHLPALADLARGQVSLRAPLASVAGELGSWLGQLRAEWAFLAEYVDGEDVWRFGSLVQRVRWLEGALAVDPDQARAALAQVWGSEPADVRSRLLGVVGVAAGADFLEAALDDRSAQVRERAALLATELPGSALGARMAERVLASVHIGPNGLTVEPPQRFDAGLLRDGVGERLVHGSPGSPSSQRVSWFRQIVAATPLDTWTGEPVDLVRLPVVGCDPSVLREGWADAAVRQRNVPWARALLGTDLATPESAALLSVLPAPERAAVVAGLLSTRRSVEVAGLITAMPGPWPAELGTLLLDWLAEHADHRAVARAAEVVAVTVPPPCLTHPLATMPSQPDVPAWRLRLTGTLAFRREMHEELR